MNPLSELSPQPLWNHFAAICAIPHPSRQEEALARHIETFADQLGLAHQRDCAGNLIIRKPATTGRESAPGVILQSHLDMVPQRSDDSNHDFSRDPIQPRINDGWVTATGTTLGADNGIGVATILAILASDALSHGPLEALLTVNEEAGMDGAKGLEPDILNGELLLNLDSEDEGELYIGCAGGVDATLTLPILRDSNRVTRGVLVTLGGLLGGHSGVDIHLPRGNANRLLGELLSGVNGQVVELEGGSLRNAIPRRAEALLWSNDLNTLESTLRCRAERLIETWRTREPGLIIEISQHPSAASPVTEASQRQLLQLLSACPNGVYRMDPTMPDVVETSNNLARVILQEQQLELQCLTRSARETTRDELCQQLSQLAGKAGANIRFDGAYPGWTPDPDSALLARVNAVHQAVTGKAAQVKVIHAGLECGLLGAVYPHWQMLSLGPTIRYPHSPGEKVEIASVARFWTLMTAILAELAR